MPEAYYAGIDVGSSAVHYAVIDRSGAIRYSPASLMHFADPVETIRRAWSDILDRFSESAIRATAFTGSGAEKFPDVMTGVIYLYDSVSIPAGVSA